jgi:acetylornithine deacetylase/succinyl-diaminopimelate desuccinylase-like protein
VLTSPPIVPSKEIIEFLQQLVSIPSVESERAIATCIDQKLTELGFEPRLLGDSEHPSVICHHQAATATKTIWLQSHLDTAPVGERTQWQHNPFAGTIVDDRVYGRGVADSKAALAKLSEGIALFIYLAKALRDSPEFNGSLFLGFDAQEESAAFLEFERFSIMLLKPMFAFWVIKALMKLQLAHEDG